jgi:hypothetical protein
LGPATFQQRATLWAACGGSSKRGWMGGADASDARSMRALARKPSLCTHTPLAGASTLFSLRSTIEQVKWSLGRQSCTKRVLAWPKDKNRDSDSFCVDDLPLAVSGIARTDLVELAARPALESFQCRGLLGPARSGVIAVLLSQMK